MHADIELLKGAIEKAMIPMVDHEYTIEIYKNTLTFFDVYNFEITYIFEKGEVFIAGFAGSKTAPFFNMDWLWSGKVLTFTGTNFFG